MAVALATRVGDIRPTGKYSTTVASSFAPAQHGNVPLCKHLSLCMYYMAVLGPVHPHRSLHTRCILHCTACAFTLTFAAQPAVPQLRCIHARYPGIMPSSVSSPGTAHCRGQRVMCMELPTREQDITQRCCGLHTGAATPHTLRVNGACTTNEHSRAIQYSACFAMCQCKVLGVFPPLIRIVPFVYTNDTAAQHAHSSRGIHQ